MSASLRNKTGSGSLPTAVHNAKKSANFSEGEIGGLLALLKARRVAMLFALLSFCSLLLDTATSFAQEEEGNARADFIDRVTQGLDAVDEGNQDARKADKFLNGKLLEKLQEKALRERLKRKRSTVLEGEGSLLDKDRSDDEMPDLAAQPMSGSVKVSRGASLETYMNRPDDGSVRMVEFSGPGALKIEVPIPEGERSSFDRKVGFFSFYIKPALATGKNDRPFLLNVGGATLGFQQYDEAGLTGKLFVSHGDLKSRGHQWIDTGIYFSLRTDGSSVRGQQFVVRVDANLKEWDLYVNGRMALGGIKLGKPSRNCWAYSPTESLAEIGSLSVTSFNPLFEDQDLDGIDDEMEAELGFSTEVNDRQSKDELDEYTNLEHFINRLRRYAPPSRSRPLPPSRTIAEEPNAVEASTKEGGQR